MATIRWGDGSTSAGTVSLVSGTAFQVTGSHAYAEEGGYGVSVTITDAGGAPPLVVNATTFNVADADLSPAGTAQTYAATEGTASGPQVVAQFNDPGTDGTAADYSATIRWGDGTTSAGAVSLVSGTTFQVTGSHAYAEEGSFPVAVTVTDAGGAAQLVVGTATFRVADAPLSPAGPSQTLAATEGAGSGPRVVAQFSDPGTDGTAADYTATIAWGDGTTSAGAVSLVSGTTFQVSGSHAYMEEGKFLVTVTVTDAGGATPLAVSDTTFDVADAPLGPAGAPQTYSAVEGAGTGPRVVAQFSDPGTDGTAADYSATIRWGDGSSSAGTVSLVSGTTFQVVGSHAYAEEGSFPVRVTITDAGGAAPLAVSSTTFSVADAALSSAGGPQTYAATEGAGSGPRVVAQFTDPGTDGTAADYTAAVRWGDGTSSAGTVSLVSGTTFQVTGSHAYAEEGRFPVAVTVTDAGGAAQLVVGTTTFAVADAPLGAAGAAQTYSATEGAGTGPSVVAQFTDPGTDGTAADYAATIAWGDGSSSAGTVSLVSGTTFQVAGPHAYAEEGSFPVSVTITDAGGAPQLVVGTATFRVADAPLSAAGGPQTFAATEGAGSGPRVLAQFTDPGTDGTAADYTATITWGDGTTSAGAVSLVSGTTFQVVGSHAYAEEGRFPVSVTVTDAGGAAPLVVNATTFNVADAALSAAGAAQAFAATEGLGTGPQVVAQFNDPGTDGTAADYTATIRWGDGTSSAGTVSLVSGTTFQVAGSHTYSEADRFPVSVTITDGGGAPPLVVSGTTFAVAEAPLSPAGVPPAYAAVEGVDTGPREVAQFADPGTDGKATGYPATIFWGDGTTSVGTVSLVSGTTFRVVGSHAYAEEGTFPVRVTVDDADHAPRLVLNSASFSVADAPLSAAGGPQTDPAVEGAGSGPQVVAQFTDAGADGTAADYTATIAWGDGTTSAGVISPAGGNTFQVVGAHTFAEEGSFPVAVTVQDVGGAPPLVVNSITFSVADAPLTAVGSPARFPAAPATDTGARVLAQFTDARPGAAAADYRATIDWGDGRSGPGVVTLAADHTFQVVSDHTYARNGTFPVAVTIQDVGGAPPLVVNSITFSVASAPTRPAPGPSRPTGSSPAAAGLNENLVLISFTDAPVVPPSASRGVGSGNETQPAALFTSLAVTALLRSGTGTGLGLGGGGGNLDAAPSPEAVAQAGAAVPEAQGPDAAPAQAGKAPAAVRGGPPTTDTTPRPVTAMLPDKPPAAPAPPVAHFHKNLLWQRLDKVGDDLAEQPVGRKAMSVGLTTVALATAGYVLLSGRAGSWLLSVLTARPLWEEYDPLVVLTAREKERQRTPRLRNEDEETLQSLVG
jgi:ABC-type transporter MlaC component